jgi:hypothetical protein
MRGYLDWVAMSRGAAEDRSDLLGGAVDRAFRFAEGDATSTSPALLIELEEATPREPSDASWATTAQDCWICADTAVRSSLASYAAQDATWYLLEPMFQTTCKRLFGFSDVGSKRQDELERQALQDPALQAAIAALHRAVHTLNTPVVDRADLERLATDLAPIRP